MADPRDPDRPSQHGAVVGQVLSDMERIGRRGLPDLPPSCLTCAFRSGSAPNQMASTAMIAFNCAMGVDPDPFGCHHGMDNGTPRKLCAGYCAALHAREHSFAEVRERVLEMGDDLARLPEHDALRADFDAWMAITDPEGKMDVYEFARAYAKRSLTPTGLVFEGNE